MKDKEVPDMMVYNNASTSYRLDDFTKGITERTSAGWKIGEPIGQPLEATVDYGIPLYFEKLAQAEKLAGRIKKTEEKKPMSEMRIVKVFIVDTDKNVPVEKRLLHQTDTIFTDMTDQDLFFDVDIKSILTKHNEYRVTLVDKKKSSATEKVHLEPIRISQLKMTVSVLAEF